ncbi:hypothetical protein ES703_109126 [subsurface metagenome]
MQIIMRYLSEKNLKRFEIDFKNLIKIVNNSEGELDIAIRENYLNIYYKGNSLAKISFNKLDKYKVEIHKKFFEGTNADNPNFWDEKTKSDNYISLTLSLVKPPLCFLQKKHIDQFCSKIKQVNYGEEIVFEQALITDNLERNNLIIIDRQITDKKLKRKRMDLLALKQIESNTYSFLVVEVKLGNNPELKGAVGKQLTDYMTHIQRHFNDYKSCYERQFEQKRKMGLINIPTAKSIEIKKP